MTRNQLKLIEKSYAEVCPACGVVSAYAWEDVNYAPLAGVDDGVGEDARVYHIPAASGFEWSCGNCGRGWASADSPIMAECYSHIER